MSRLSRASALAFVVGFMFVLTLYASVPQNDLWELAVGAVVFLLLGILGMAAARESAVE